MADFYIDPSAATNGAGTFASPYNTWSGRSLAAGNRYLQKWGTTYAGSIAPTGNGAAGNRAIIGVYDHITGAFMDGVVGGAFVDATGQSYGIGLGAARTYVTVSGFEVFGGTNYGVLKESTGSSSTEAQHLWLENCVLRNSLGVGADLRGKGNRVINCDVYGNASDGLFIVGDDFELGRSNVYNNGTTSADGDCVQLRDASNFWIHDSTLDHSLSPYKQAFICTLENVLGTTSGRVEDNRIACASYVSGVTAADQKTVQILTPGVKVRRNRIEGGQFGAYMQGADGVLVGNLIVCNGAGSVVGVAIRESGVEVAHNTVVGEGLIGIDHSDAGYTGVTIKNNTLVGWPQGIRTAASGATYSHNAFKEVTVRNANLAGAEGTAGAGDITGDLMLVGYRPRAGSPLVDGGTSVGYVRDIERKQGRAFVGAYCAARLVEVV